MNLNRAELRKTLYDFNSISNRLLQANIQDYTSIVSKFIVFIQKTPLIFDYIKDCGECEQDMAQEFNEVSQSYGRCIFSIGETQKEEIRNIYAILEYISTTTNNMLFSIVYGYSSAKSYQDRLKAFNDRVVMVLIRHIESYLTKIGIDMGVDEKVTYSITVNNGQAIIANDSSVVTVTNNIEMDIEQMSNLIQNIKVAAEKSKLSEEENETLNDSLDTIEEETKSKKPKRSLIKTAINGIKVLKGTAEFAAAVTALIQFLQPLF
jgi:hypothetical protein